MDRRPEWRSYFRTSPYVTDGFRRTEHVEAFARRLFDSQPHLPVPVRRRARQRAGSFD